MKRILFIFVLGGLATSPVAAHRLTADWQVTDNTLVLVGRTDGAPATGAEVQLQSASGATLAEGTLDAAGVYRWPLNATGDVTVVVNAGLGHRRTFVLSADDLRAGAAPSPASSSGQPLPVASAAQGIPGAQGSTDGSSPLAVRVVLGLTFLLAATATGMSFSNRRRLAQLEQRGPQHESRS